MPSTSQILEGLEAIAIEWRPLAIAWHVALGALLIAIARGWRAERRTLGLLLASPVACVGALAWSSGNAFNGPVFLIVSAGLVALALPMPGGAGRMAPRPFVIAGGALVAFGWVYPHFVNVETWFSHLYAAPLGLIPCPTLSAVIGLTLLMDGLDSRMWSRILAAVGALYGLIGWWRLGVTIDVVLLIGAVVLGAGGARGPRDSSALG